MGEMENKVGTSNVMFCNRFGENSEAVSEDAEGVFGAIHIRTYKIPTQRNLSNLVQFHNQGYVKTIDVTTNSYNDVEGENCSYDYKITVRARGPEGLSRFGYLYLTDMAGNVHKMDFYLAEEKDHTLHFNSANPNIRKIEWRNDPL